MLLRSVPVTNSTQFRGHFIRIRCSLRSATYFLSSLASCSSTNVQVHSLAICIISSPCRSVSRACNTSEKNAIVLPGAADIAAAATCTASCAHITSIVELVGSRRIWFLAISRWVRDKLGECRSSQPGVLVYSRGIKRTQNMHGLAYDREAHEI